MKKIYMLLLFFGCIVSTSIVGTTNNIKDIAKEIDLNDDLPPAKLRSLIKPVRAFIADRFIEVDFYDALGTLVISIYDETGSRVYQQSLNSYTGLQWLIDITFFDPGVYTIELVNSQTNLSGEFEIEE